MARTFPATFIDRHAENGAVAQLGERMNGIHEVRGSIPLGSTNRIKGQGVQGRPELFQVLVMSIRSVKLAFTDN